MKKKIVALVLTAVAVMNVVGCGGNSKTAETTAATETTVAETESVENADSATGTFDELTLSMGYSSANGTVNDVCMNYAADLLAEKSGGSITLDLYPAAQLGNDKELLTECVGGNVPMVSCSTAAAVGMVPELAIFDLPCAFSDVATVRAAINGEDYFQTISSWFEAKGMKLLLINPIGLRYLTSNVDVQSAADIAGINIRTMENNNHMAFWSALGANPSPIAANDVYLSLQQGLVDSQEGATTGIINSKYYEQQKHLIKTSHLAQIFVVVIGLDAWNSMSADTQALFETCFAETRDYMSSYADEQEAKDIENLQAYGMTYKELSADDIATMQEAAQGVYDSISSSVGEDIINGYLAAIDAVK